MPTEVEWDDFYVKFEAALGEVNASALQIAAPIVYRALARIQELLSVVPPEPARDRAKHFNTYVRNIGRFPKAAFAQTAEGLWQRKRKGAYDQGQVRYTSQQSSKRWGIYVTDTPASVVGTLRNDATYSGWVFGPKDESLDPHQVKWHTETGWVSQDDALSGASSEIDAMLQEATQQIISNLMKEGG